MKQKTIHKQENISYNPGLEKSQPVRKQYPENETFDQGNDIFQNEFFTPISPRKHKLKYCFNCGRQINFYTKICHYCETSQPEIIPQTNELYFKTKYRITSEKKIDNKNQIPVKNDSINSDFFFQNHIDNDFSEQIIIDNNKYNTIKIKPYIDKKKIKRINDSHTYLNYITINHKFINRDYEYDLLYDKARKLNYGKGCLVIIQGESGIGKSVLKTKFIKNINQNINFLEIQMKPFNKEPDYTVLLKILKNIFNLKNNISEKEISSRTDNFINKLFLNKEDFKYNEKYIFNMKAIIKLYLNGLINKDEILFLNNLDHIKKEELFLSSIEKIFYLTAIKNYYNIIILENAQYTDKKSYLFLKTLTMKLNQFPLMLLIISNNNWFDTQNMVHENLSFVRLNYFAKDEIIAVISALFKNRRLNIELKEFIWNYSLGNPYVAKNLIKFLYINGYLRISDLMVEIKQIKTIHIPQSLKQLIHFQISSLTQTEKEILYFYSVFSQTVTLNILNEYLKLSGISDYEANFDLIIQNLCINDFIEDIHIINKNIKDCYTATDSAITYVDALLKQQEKERINYLCAVIIENNNKECLDSVLDNLIFHYEKSKNLKKIFYYKKRKADLLNFNFADKKPALDLYLNCLNNISLLSTDVETLDLYLNLGSLYFDIYKNSTKAISLIDRGKSIAENLNDNYLLVRAWEIKSDIYLKTDQRNDAFLITMNIKEKAEEIADRQMLIFANQRLGFLCKNNNNKKAIHYYKTAAELIQNDSTRQTDKSTYMDVYLALAELYALEQNQVKAIEYYENILKILDFEKDKPFICELLQKLAFCFLAQKNISSAINCLDETNVLLKEIKDQIGLIYLKKNYGQLYLHEKEYTKAMDYFNSALYFAKKNKNNQAEGQLLCKIGECYLHLKKPAIALSHVQKGITFMERIHDKQGLAGSGYWLLSSIKFDLKDIIGAKRALQDQYRLAKELKNTEYIHTAKKIEQQIKEFTQNLTVSKQGFIKTDS